jgi:dCTP diphosphatase
VPTLDDLARRLQGYADERDWNQFHSPKNLAAALSVEVAEILEHFQWLTQEESRALREEKLAEIREEIGDVLIYLVRLADVLDIDPMEAALDKLAKNEEKYPAERVRGKALKYTEYYE